MNLHVSTMTGKLEDLTALSTTCVCNPICVKRMKSGHGVCPWCFGEASVRLFPSLGAALRRNFDTLTGELIDDETAIRTACKMRAVNNIARIESFGDVYNVVQARNYLRIIRAGAAIGLHFGVWTKNPGIWKQAIKLEGRPDNMTFILSSPELNTPDVKTALKYDFIDATFTVYTNVHEKFDAIMAGSVSCQCGRGSCDRCRFCYSYRRPVGKLIPVDIAELLRNKG